MRMYNDKSMTVQASAVKIHNKKLRYLESMQHNEMPREISKCQVKLKYHSQTSFNKKRDSFATI